MLYLLLNESKQAPWQVGYELTFVKELKARGVAVYCVYRVPSELDEEDILWVMHYKDLKLASVRTTKAQVAYRMSGTATHPYCYQVDDKEENYLLRNVIDLNFTFHPRVSSYVQSFYPDARFIATGFPVDVPAKLHAGKRSKRIVVGGRVSPDKQFMLSSYLLQPYLSEGYEVAFCYPNSAGKDIYWMDQYGGKSRYEALGFQFYEMNRETWLATLATSEFFFTASLGDISSSSCIEAVQMGCYPLVPRIEKGLPCYDVYLNVGYEPFSVSSLRTLIEEKPRVVVDDTWFNPAKWADRFIKEVLT